MTQPHTDRAQQKVLRLYHTKREFTFTTWVNDSNPHTTDYLTKRLQSTPQTSSVLYLWGEQGAGRSHISQACASAVVHMKQAAFYLSLSQPNLSPEVLSNLGHFDWIILDDIPSIMENPIWQTPLIELYHRILEHPSQTLLVTSTEPPHHIKGALPDTITRLQAATPLKIDPLKEEESLKKMLILRASFRQLTLPERSIDYLLYHTKRQAGALIDLLDALEKQSLIEKRPISIPFIKSCLNSNIKG